MPYIPPKPRQAKAVSPDEEPELEKTASSITPAFTSSTFDTASKAEMYSAFKHANAPEIITIAPNALSPTMPGTTDIVSQESCSSSRSVSAHPSPSPASVNKGDNVQSPDTTAQTPSLSDHTDVFSQPSLSRASTTSTATPVISKRSSWSHRKPVPSVITLPTNNLPSSHPFARGAPSPHTRAELGSPPVSPRLAGPVPPRRAGTHNRSISNLQTPASPAASDMSEGSGMFWRPPVPGVNQIEGEDVEELQSDAAETQKSSPEMVRKRSPQQPKHIPSRNSSRQSTPTPSHAPELGAPISTGHQTASSVSSHQTEQRTPPGSSAQHPLRLRVDKSLPALPLDADQESIAPRRASRHTVRASTSSGPSTQIVTPRSDSQAFAPQQERSGDQEKRRIKWPRSLIDLSRGRKDKSTESGGGDQVAESGQVDPEEDVPFSVDRIPSKRRLFEAGTLFLRDENGDLVCFGDMFPKTPTSIETDHPAPPMPRTVVFFIRHFWCGQCQDFMFASLSQLDPVAVEKAGIKVIVISNGSWKIIKSYKKLFKCPFPIYVDGPRKLYSLLG